MKTILLFLLLISSFAYGQLAAPQTIGQPSRNQATGNGLQIADTLYQIGSVVMFPNVITAGDANDSSLVKDNATGQLKLRPQGAAVDTTGMGTLPAWSLTGNSGTSAGTNFLGTTDGQRLWFKTDNTNWMWLDTLGRLNLHAGYDTTVYDSASGFGSTQFITDNLFIGVAAGDSMQYSIINSAASRSNLGIGKWALRDNKFGYNNLAIGHGALTYLNGAWVDDTNPFDNGFEVTAVGNYAGHHCRTCEEDVFVGTGAGTSCISCQGCTFVGTGAGSLNVANTNTGLGTFALLVNTTGTNNVAVGSSAMQNSTTGSSCTFIGAGAGQSLGTPNTGGSNNGHGRNTLSGNTSGLANSAFGTLAGVSNTSGNWNMFLGYNSGSTNTTQHSQWFLSNVDGFTTRTQDTTCWVYGKDFFDIADRSFKVSAKFGIYYGSPLAGRKLIAQDANGYTLWAVPEINTTAGDGATINKTNGRFRKDTSGTTFTLTNSFITANSIIILTFASDPGATGYGSPVVVAGAGSAVITFMTAGSSGSPGNDTDVNFIIEN